MEAPAPGPGGLGVSRGAGATHCKGAREEAGGKGAAGAVEGYTRGIVVRFWSACDVMVGTR